MKQQSINRQSLARLFHGYPNSKQQLDDIGGEQGLADALKVKFDVGQLDENLQRQRDIFGVNLIEPQKAPLIKQLINEYLEDTVLQILLACSLGLIILGTIQEGFWEGWTEGGVIFVAILILVGVTAARGKFFIQDVPRSRKLVTVIREANSIQIDAEDLVVGDLLVLNPGETLCVDGIIVGKSKVLVDESAMTGESEEFEKGSDNPFLISGTTVAQGTGTMLVLTVGNHTFSSRILVLQTGTPLQEKLSSLTERVGPRALFVAATVVTVLIVHEIVDRVGGRLEYDLVSITTLRFLLRSILVGGSLVVVGVPESLPLIATISLASAVRGLLRSNNLVRKLSACEALGEVTDVCTDKTGTLTMNQMEVVELFLGNQQIANLSSPPQTASLFARAVCYNSTADLYEGMPTERALIRLADQWEYKLSTFRPSPNILRVIKVGNRMISVVDDPEAKKVVVYAKGASEVLLEKCTNILDKDGTFRPLLKDEIESIKNTVIDVYANHACRTLAIAYREVVWNQGDGRVTHTDWSDEQLDGEFTLIAIVGIRDRVRFEVPGAVQWMKSNGVTVRMITGDNATAARQVAKEVGILDDDANSEYAVLEGHQLRELVGATQSRRNGKMVLQVKDMQRFKSIAKELKVLARATPEDKLILVTGLMDLGKIVAVTGDGTNDAPALSKADVGFSMGISGTEIAREASDIILLDDNFRSMIPGLQWGRNVFSCLRKFIQFQLTAIPVTLAISLIGAVVLKEPLSPTKLLWLNLIVDILGSIAIATQPPTNRIPQHSISREEDLITPKMQRTIIGQSIYQIAVLSFVLIELRDFFDASEQATNLLLQTIVFQTLVLIQVFTAFSSHNQIFLQALWGLIVVLQYLLVHFGGALLQVVPLSIEQHILCLALAASTLLVQFPLNLVVPKKVPARLKLD